MTDAEVRHLTISLLTQETDRDRQTRVGASNLSDPCDRSLAYAMAGESNRSAAIDRYWLGRVIGSAMGGLWEDRAIREPNLTPEKHVWFGDIAGYGKVGGSIDLLVEDEDHLIDYKGTTRADIAILEDLLQAWGLHRVGEKPRWEHMARGNWKLTIKTDVVMSLSDAKYKKAMEKMEFKLNRYRGQLSLYMLSGAASRASIVFFARDGNAGFDNPALDGYENPNRKHDIFVFSFNLDREFAEGLLTRAGDIWAKLQAGAKPKDFEAHDLCFECELARENEERDAIVAAFEGVEATA